MKLWLITLVALLTVVGSVWAQPQPPPGNGDGPRRGALPPDADANGDGKVDEIEAAQAARQRVDMLKRRLEEATRQFDADGDGTLNEQELAALKNKMAERGGAGRGPAAMLGMIDTNGDWKISAEEEAAALQAVARRIQQGEGPRGEMARGMALQDPDTNGDCIIDDTEARVVAERRVDMGRKLIDRLRERNADNPDAPYPPMVADLDTDRNFDVSDAEAQAAVQRFMAELQKRNAVVLRHYDTDNDGKLNETELAAAKTAFAFMNEVRPERGDMGERAGDALRERLRERPARRDGEPRRREGQGLPPAP